MVALKPFRGAALLLASLCVVMVLSTLSHNVHAQNDGFITYPSLDMKPYTVTYDQRSVRINDSPTVFLSGSIHYPRCVIGLGDATRLSDVMGRLLSAICTAMMTRTTLLSGEAFARVTVFQITCLYCVTIIVYVVLCRRNE